MIRIVSSLSKLVRFGDKDLLVDEGQPFTDILFFVKGEANIYKKIKLEGRHGVW